ncbi:hypothetical protein BV20DRAFT_964894 [Pilatotrama ljubarskyi]|nr:hypothetical protein BV20DRAFT_964894 [Pilatotrama ljubarskyi]
MSSPEETSSELSVSSDDFSSPSSSPQGTLVEEPVPGPAPAGRAALDLLRYAALRGDLNNIPQLVLSAVSDPHADTNALLALVDALIKLGVDFYPAWLALQDRHRFHCARCHAWYMEYENGPGACVVPHQPPSYTFVLGDDVTYPARHYYCCGLTEVVYPDIPDVPSVACYVGPHAPSSLPAYDLRAPVRTCEDLGCFGRPPTPPAEPPNPPGELANALGLYGVEQVPSASRANGVV